MSFITSEWARKTLVTRNRSPSAAAKCSETTRTTLLRFALSHRPNLNYLQFYGRRNVIIMRAKDHIAVGSRGWWRSYLPPWPPSARRPPFSPLALTSSLRRAFPPFTSIFLSPSLTLSHSLSFLNDPPQNRRCTRREHFIRSAVEFHRPLNS